MDYANGTPIGLKLNTSALGAANGAASLASDGLHKVSEYRPATADAHGAMPPEFIRSNSLTSLEGGASPTPGYIYRSTGAGTVVKAQADTSAHAAGVVGVGEATLGIAPLTGMRTIKCVAAPVIGSAMYVSTTLGKIHTVRYLGLDPVGVVVADASVGSDYAAVIYCLAPPKVSNVDMRDSILAETAEMLGGSPLDYYCLGDDFETEREAYEDDGTKGQVVLPYNLRVPNWGIYTCNSGSHLSKGPTTLEIPGNAGAGSDVWKSMNVLASPYICANKGMLSVRFAIPAGTSKWYIGIGGETGLGFGTWADSDATKYYVMPCISRPFYSTPTAGELIEVGTRDTSQHRFDAILGGEGSFRWRFDMGAWSSDIAHSTHGTAATELTWFRVAGSVGVSLDWLYLTGKRP